MLGRPDVVQKAASYQNFSLPWSQIDLERDLVLVSYRFDHLIPILQAADYIFYCKGCALSQADSKSESLWNSNGMIPKLIRFALWILANDFAITPLTPRYIGASAACSLLDP